MTCVLHVVLAAEAGGQHALAKFETKVTLGVLIVAEEYGTVFVRK